MAADMRSTVGARRAVRRELARALGNGSVGVGRASSRAGRAMAASTSTSGGVEDEVRFSPKTKTKATDDESRVTDDESTRANAGDALYCVIFLIRAPRRRLSGRGRGATCEANLTNLRRSFAASAKTFFVRRGDAVVVVVVVVVVVRETDARVSPSKTRRGFTSACDGRLKI